MIFKAIKTDIVAMTKEEKTKKIHILLVLLFYEILA